MGPSNRVRAKGNASFPRRAAKRFAKPRRLTADRKHAWSPAEAWGGLRRAAKPPPRKCVVTLFAARGPKGRLEPWRCAAAGAAGALWNRGGAARSPGARKFPMRPQGTQGIGNNISNKSNIIYFSSNINESTGIKLILSNQITKKTTKQNKLKRKRQ